MATDIETQTKLHIMLTNDPDKIKLSLEYQGRKYTFSWQGKDVAFRAPPTVRGVLEHFHISCSADTSNFEDWCDEFGYDPDRISNLNTFHAVKREEANLRRLFGQDYQSFLDLNFDLDQTPPMTKLKVSKPISINYWRAKHACWTYKKALFEAGHQVFGDEDCDLPYYEEMIKQCETELKALAADVQSIHDILELHWGDMMEAFEEAGGVDEMHL